MIIIGEKAALSTERKDVADMRRRLIDILLHREIDAEAFKLAMNALGGTRELDALS
jgi:hypothetical protein